MRSSSSRPFQSGGRLGATVPALQCRGVDSPLAAVDEFVAPHDGLVRFFDRHVEPLFFGCRRHGSRSRARLPCPARSAGQDQPVDRAASEGNRRGRRGEPANWCGQVSSPRHVEGPAVSARILVHRVRDPRDDAARRPRTARSTSRRASPTSRRPRRSRRPRARAIAADINQYADHLGRRALPRRDRREVRARYGCAVDPERDDHGHAAARPRR